MSFNLASLSSRAIRGFFFQQLALSPTTWADGIANLFDSDQDTEDYPFVSHAPVVRQWISGRHVKSLDAKGATVTNLPYEGTLEVTAKEREQDKTGQIQIRINDLIRRFGTHWLSLLAVLINNGHTALAWDGLSFFNNAHVNGDSGTIDNLHTLNIAGTPNDPTGGEMEKLILAGVQQMFGFKDTEGEPLNEDATSFTVVAPVNYFSAMAAALNSEILIDGSTSRTNTLTKLGGFSFTPVITPRMTADDKIFIFRNDTASKAIIRQEEKKVDLKSQAEGSHIEFTEGKHWYGIDARRGANYGMFEYAVSVQAT